MPMIRLRELSRPCLLLLASIGTAIGQEPATPPPVDEVSQLKTAIENQSRQIEALTKQVADLNQRLGAQPKPAPAAAPAAPAPTATEPAPQPEVASSESGVKHTVAKGETLTSIAKRYNIPLSALEKANKIENDRMLQIGRVLNIPPAANKTSESPKEQKENP